MKRLSHSHDVIRWLGEPKPSSLQRYAVVEVDHLGPILRKGPYSDARTARRAAQRLDVERATEGRRPGRTTC